MLKVTLQLLFIFFPWPIRRKLLNFLFGYNISKYSHIGFSIVVPDELTMLNNSIIGNFVFCKNIDQIYMGEKSQIGNFNYITGFNSKNKILFPSIKNRKCKLEINEHSHITSRHFIDCNGGVYIGKYSIVAGIRSQILTHSIDIYSNTQSAASVYIGDYCFVGTGCIILKGTRLPDYSILGAGSVLTKTMLNPFALYAGNPAIFIKYIDHNKVEYFKREDGYVL